jgi:hypothetical protein
MRKLLVSTAAVIVLTAAGHVAAQTPQGTEKPKPLSPPAHAEGSVGGKKIAIDYSAPSKRGRAIMGGLVPYGSVWRTGANAATTLHAGGDLRIGDLAVPAGDYTLYSVPGEKEWTLIVNKETGQWGTEYDQKQDLGRVKMKIAPVKDTVETFVIAIKPAGDGATLTLTWENTEASVALMAAK